jgi:hypothetical protein
MRVNGQLHAPATIPPGKELYLERHERKIRLGRPMHIWKANIKMVLKNMT